MKNKSNSGHTITHSAAGATVAGIPSDLGGKAGVPVSTKGAGEENEYEISGVKRFKNDGGAKAFMAVVDWDVAGGQIVTGGTGDFELGRLVEATLADTEDYEVLVNFLPGPGPSFK